jgi:hypothetical protein
MYKPSISNRRFPACAPATALAGVLALAGMPVTTFAAAPADELRELKAAADALQKRIEQLEETNDKQTDQIAMARSAMGSWVQNFTWKGDFRYRNENIDQEFAPERNRDRIRVRAGFVAKVNDTTKVEVGLATSEYGGTLTDGGDPRSSNQTLTNGNSRKAVFVDLAYAEWQPHADWKFTVGKMKYPWVRAGQSVFFDGDVNPEGLAINFAHGDFFASTFYNILEERSTAGESTMGGVQLGWKPLIGPGRLTLAAGYFDANSVQNRAPVYVGANGNTTKNTGCFAGTGCLANDYDLMQAIVQYDFTAVAGRPLSLYVDYVKNDKAINNMDTAYSAGILYGKASDPRTWEIGYYYAKVEKDALYGEYIDSDWGGGSTDAKGSTLKFAYAFAKGWTFNGTYFLNKTNIDVAASGTGVPAGTFNRDYKRLQLDLNFKF